MRGLQLITHPSLSLELQCSVCRNYIDSLGVDDTQVQAKLFGAAKYAVCSCCGQEIKAPWDRNYKARWQRYAKAHRLILDKQQDITATALRMMRREGVNKALRSCADYAYGMHDAGPAREYWKAVNERIADLSMVRVPWWAAIN